MFLNTIKQVIQLTLQGSNLIKSGCFSLVRQWIIPCFGNKLKPKGEVAWNPDLNHLYHTPDHILVLYTKPEAKISNKQLTQFKQHLFSIPLGYCRKESSDPSINSKRTLRLDDALKEIFKSSRRHFIFLGYLDICQPKPSSSTHTIHSLLAEKTRGDESTVTILTTILLLLTS